MKSADGKITLSGYDRTGSSSTETRYVKVSSSKSPTITAQGAVINSITFTLDGSFPKQTSFNVKVGNNDAVTLHSNETSNSDNLTTELVWNEGGATSIVLSVAAAGGATSPQNVQFSGIKINYTPIDAPNFTVNVDGSITINNMLDGAQYFANANGAVPPANGSVQLSFNGSNTSTNTIAKGTYAAGSIIVLVAKDGADAYSSNASQVVVEDVIGKIDFTSGFRTSTTNTYEISKGKTRTFSFVNHRTTSNDLNYKNWAVIVQDNNSSTNGSGEYALLNCYPQVWISGADTPTHIYLGNTSTEVTDWAQFRSDMQNANVTVKMALNDAGDEFAMYATMEANGRKYIYPYTQTITAADKIYTYFTVENSYITGMNAPDATDLQYAPANISDNRPNPIKVGDSFTATYTPASGFTAEDFTVNGWGAFGTDADQYITVTNQAATSTTITANAEYSGDGIGYRAFVYPASALAKSQYKVGWDQGAVITSIESAAPAVTVTSVMVSGIDYVKTLEGTSFKAISYYGDPTIVVTLSDGTQPEVTKPSGSSSMSDKSATFSAGGVEYTIKYRQQNVSTKDLTVLSDKEATTWNFNQLTRPAKIIGNWTWNNMTIFASEDKPINVGGNSSSFVDNLPVGAQRQQSFAITTSGPGTLTFNAEANGSRNVKIVDYNGNEIGNITIGHVKDSSGENYSWEYNGSSMPIYFYVSDNPVARINSITWTPKKPVTSITIPEAVTVHVGELHRFTADTEIAFKNGDNVVNASELSEFTKTWTITNGSSNIDLENKSRTEGKVTGAKSNTSDDATAKVKLTVAGVESNECTITVVRAPLAVRADHIALSHNGNASRTLQAVVYNPYNRKVVSSNIDLTAAIKSGTSAFANSTDNTITPFGTAIGTETWTVTATPMSGKTEENLYASGTADIQVTCRDYLYAYSTSVPATSPTARPVQNASGDIALNYYAGHNPAGCYGQDKDTKEYYVLKTWGDSNRAPQEQTLANYRAPKTNNSDDKGQKPYARINGWDGIKNVAEPTMNSLSEQHTASTDKNDHANGKFSYQQYSYSGDHDEFDVPVMGSFYRFYPEKNGTLIAYLCVNGQFSDSQMNDLASGSSTGYANRKTYFLDPYATSMDIQNATVQPTSTIQPGFFYYTLDNCTGLDNFKKDVVTLLNNWAAWGNDEKNTNGELVIPVLNSSYSAGKTSYTINDVDWTLFKNLAQDKVGIFHQPIANGDGSFRVITKTYVRCEVPVEKGRVYYVSPTGTKTRMAGVEFVPDTEDPVAVDVNFYNGINTAQTDAGDYILDNAAKGGTGADAGFDKNVTMESGNYYNVTLADRKFTAGQWYTFCMPFDVPEKQIHDIFGEDAVTIHFDNVKEEKANDGSTTINMNFWSHFYDQIRAGRPIMIKMPAEEFPASSQATSDTDSNGKAQLTNVTFNHVKYNPVNPESLFMTDGKWTFQGTYTPVTMGKNAVIVNGTTFYHYLTTAKTLAGNRAWIQGPANLQAPVVTSIRLFNSNEEEATGIEAVLSEMGFNVMKTTDKIYNLNGQMVGQGADINNLPKGVYIVNGKKQIVK